MARLGSDWLQLVVAFLGSLTAWFLTVFYRPPRFVPGVATVSTGLPMASDVPAGVPLSVSILSFVPTLVQQGNIYPAVETILYNFIVIGVATAVPFGIAWFGFEWSWSIKRLVVASLLLYSVPIYVTLFLIEVWFLFYPQALVIGFGLVGTVVAYFDSGDSSGPRLGNDWVQFMIVVGLGCFLYVLPIFIL
jgi:hypothetical protein